MGRRGAAREMVCWWVGGGGAGRRVRTWWCSFEPRVTAASHASGAWRWAATGHGFGEVWEGGTRYQARVRYITLSACHSAGLEQDVRPTKCEGVGGSGSRGAGPLEAETVRGRSTAHPPFPSPLPRVSSAPFVFVDSSAAIPYPRDACVGRPVHERTTLAAPCVSAPPPLLAPLPQSISILGWLLCCCAAP